MTLSELGAKKALSLFAFCFSASIILIGQNPTIQDCLGAIPVCQEMYMEQNSPVGDGNFNNEINVGISCTAGELNSIWYTFTAQSSGQLGFIITPNDANDDYDWSLFDITNAECEDIFSNPNLQVSCNAAGGVPCHGPTGANGQSAWDVQGGGCGGNPPATGNTPFNDFVDMQAGRTYVLMVSNWTGSPNGYTLDFAISSGAGIFDETLPQVLGIETPTECEQNAINIEFSENIQCTSVQANDFVLTGPGGPYSLTVISNDCSLGGEYDRTFTLLIDPPIASRGDFTLELLGGINTNFLDLCDNPANAVTYNFTVDDPIDVDFTIGADTSLVCEGDTLLLDVSDLGFSYLWQDGSMESSLPISTAGVYGVTIENECGFGNDEIEVFVQTELPDVELGADQILCEGETYSLDVTNEFANYSWSNGSTNPTLDVTTTGLISVDVTNSCGTVSDQVMIEFIPMINADLGADQFLCQGEIVTLDVDQNSSFVSYTWQDGSTSPSLTLDKTGSYAVTITTDCETFEDEVMITFIDLHEPVALGIDTTLCPGDSLSYDLSIPGATYQWSDGTDASSYVINSAGLYEVTVTSACNESSDAIRVDYFPAIQTNIGQDTFLCPGERLLLDAAAGVAADYQWSDGSTESDLIVQNPGRYSVTVSNDCEIVINEINITECEICDVFVPNIFSPNDDGFNDIFRPLSDCAFFDFSMKIFDRWGSVIFETQDPGGFWNGKFGGNTASQGVYVWWIEYTVVEDGHPRSESVTGDITLVR